MESLVSHLSFLIKNIKKLEKNELYFKNESIEIEKHRLYEYLISAENSAYNIINLILMGEDATVENVNKEELLKYRHKNNLARSLLIYYLIFLK